MIVALDTSAFQHLVRTPRKAKKGKPKKGKLPRFETRLDSLIKARRLQLAFDNQSSLRSEWERTCGKDIVGVMLALWEPYGGQVIIRNPRRFGHATMRALHRLGFDDVVDRLVLSLSASNRDRHAVSEDPDFWDPRDRRAKGQRNAPVARFCREQLNIRVSMLGELLTQLGAAA
jgi:hypothetical protein